MTEHKIWEEIEVPGEVREIIINAVAEGHGKFTRERKEKYRKAAAAAMAAAAACFMAVAIGFWNPVAARAYSSIPVIGNIFAYLYHVSDSEIPYAQVAESAIAAETRNRTGPEDLVLPEADTGASVRISIKEYFCDKYSLYLSFEVVSVEALVEGVPDLGGKKGNIQMFAEEKITTEAGECFEIGSGALMLSGVFMDEHTFVGIARSGKSLEGYSLTDEMRYEISAGHMKVYAEEKIQDIEGEWKTMEKITCTEENVITKRIEEKIRGDILLKEVKIQPYEIQVVIEEPKETALAAEAVCIEVFDDQGRRLSAASDSACRFTEEGGVRQEIWMFQRPADAEKVTVFAVDEIKWLDEWKGYLYCDDPWSGQQMIDFLKENCLAYGEAELR